MLLTAVLAGIAASLLLTTASRYHTTYQSASWQEAIIGAESGVDLAMNELRKRVTQGPSASFQLNWTTTNTPAGTAYPDFGHAFPPDGSRATRWPPTWARAIRPCRRVCSWTCPGPATSPMSKLRHPARRNAVASYLSAVGQPEPARYRRGGSLQLVVSHPLGGYRAA